MRDLNKDYVMSYEDLKKLVNTKVKGSNLRKGLALYLLRFKYRNSYGTINGEYGLESEFNYNYPKNLVDELDIPVGRYGFVNLDLSSYLCEGVIDEGINEENVYDNLEINLDTPQREDMEKYLDYVIEIIDERTDFTLVDFCHERDLFLKAKPYLVGDKELDSEFIYEKNGSLYIRGTADILLEDNNY